MPIHRQNILKIGTSFMNIEYAHIRFLVYSVIYL